MLRPSAASLLKRSILVTITVSPSRRISINADRPFLLALFLPEIPSSGKICVNNNELSVQYSLILAV